MMLRIAAAAAVLAVMAVLPVMAQSTSATITGTVTDGKGAAVDAAVVQARSEETGTVRTAVTDRRGIYTIDLLTPGRWTVIARHPEGQVSDSRHVDLALNRTHRIDLKVGTGLTERVDVVADIPLVDPQRIGGELRIGGDQSDGLPIAGRTVTDLALIDASVRTAPAGNFYGERGSVFVVNGQTGRSNSFLVDGLDNNDQSSGTSMNSFFSQQVIREFVVLTHQYSPEFGRAAGGVLNVVTHRGGNETAGELFVQGTTDDWNSPGRLVESLEGGSGLRDGPARLHVGFRQGGAFKKDRAFWFLAFEHQKNNEIVPYTSLIRGNVPAIPEATFDSAVLPPVMDVVGRLPGGRTVSPNRSDNLFFRTDFNLSDSQYLMIRLSLDDRETDDLNVGGRFSPEAGFRLEEQDVQLAATWTSIVSASVLNELRFLAGTSTFNQYANSDRPGVQRPSGLFGGNNLNRQMRDETRIQLVENLTWKLNRHTLKFGMDILRSRTEISTRFNPRGNFLYTTDFAFEPGDCGDLIINQIDPENPKDPVDCPGISGVDDDDDGFTDEAGYLFTYPLVYTYIFGEPSAVLDDTRFGLFAQDSWEATGNLLLDYGFRYDVSTFTLPESTIVPSTIPNGGAGRDWNNIAPRFGFTYTPGERGAVIRGGAGVFHDKLVLGFPAVASITSGTRIGMVFPQGLTFEWNEEIIEQVIDLYGFDFFREFMESGVLFAEDLVMRFSTGTRLETPYTVQFTVGAELPVSRRSVLSADLVRSRGYRLPQMRDLNPVVALDPPCLDDEGNPDPDDFDCVGIPVHRDENTGSIAAVVTDGRSWYSGLDLAYRWRGEDAWFSTSYTWSKSQDTGPDPLKGGISLPPDPDDVASEKGLSDFDIRHRLVVAGEMGLPWMGLRASAVIQFATGLPFNVTTGLDENYDGINTDRPPGVGRNTGEDTPLDAVNEIRRDEGLPEVETLHQPSFAQVDVRITKPFFTGGGKRSGEAYIQVFNLLNRFNGGPVDGQITSLYFGRPVGYAGPPRSVEAGLKFAF